MKNMGKCQKQLKERGGYLTLDIFDTSHKTKIAWKVLEVIKILEAFLDLQHQEPDIWALGTQMEGVKNWVHGTFKQNNNNSFKIDDHRLPVSWKEELGVRGLQRVGGGQQVLTARLIKVVEHLEQKLLGSNISCKRSLDLAVHSPGFIYVWMSRHLAMAMQALDIFLT